MLMFVLQAASIPSVDVGGAVGFLNYGVLGILTLGFIRGWVVSPRERDRLVEDNKLLKEELGAANKEIARLNIVLQEQLQAMVTTTDKQIELIMMRMNDRRDPPGGTG